MGDAPSASAGAGVRGPIRTILVEARWQISAAALVLGPALGVFGWAAAFTTVGAQATFLGIALSIAGWEIRPTRYTFAFALAGLFVAIGWTIVWIVVLSGLARLF